jgi:hypothetical protein
MVRAARTLDPDNAQFAMIETEVMKALGMTEALLTRIAEQREHDPLNTDLFVQELALTVQTGGHDRSNSQIDEQHRHLLEGGVDAETAASLTSYFEAVAAYHSGDAQAYAEKLAEAGDDSFAFEAAMSSGRIEDAAAALTANPERNGAAYAELLLYVGAHRTGNSALAGTHLKAATAKLGEGDYDERCVAEALAGTERPQHSRLLKCGILPSEKATILTALGTRFPERRDAYFSLARRLNYNRGFPHLFLNEVLD